MDRAYSLKFQVHHCLLAWLGSVQFSSTEFSLADTTCHKTIMHFNGYEPDCHLHEIQLTTLHVRMHSVDFRCRIDHILPIYLNLNLSMRFNGIHILLKKETTFSKFSNIVPYDVQCACIEIDQIFLRYKNSIFKVDLRKQ